MKIFSALKKKNACGLDIGHNWAKVVYLTPHKKKDISLERIGRVAWKAEDRNNNEKSAKRLQDLWQNLELQNKSRAVVSSMAGHAVIIKQVDLPATKTRNLDQTIKTEAEQYIPFDINDVYLDFQVLGEGAQENTHRVMLVASKKDMVHELQNLFDAAGLGAMIIDVDGLALSNCFEYNYPESLAETTYLLDIGGSHSTFCVYSQRQPAFIRDVGFGGQQITDRFASLMNKNNLEAEQIKISGFDKLDDNERDSINQECESIFLNWAEEIQRLINFYQNSLEKPQAAEKLYLSGGGSLLAGLPYALSQHLGLEIEYLNPWRNIKWEDRGFDSEYLNNIGPQFTICVGLALRAII